ncbi:MAG: hypothetical protein PHX70_12180 [Clostridium sp.]|nr:hypothetical protein [Clostridium sp.]
MNDKEISHTIAEVKATLAVEGLFTTRQEEDIYREYLKGHLTEKEALKKIGLIPLKEDVN